MYAAQHMLMKAEEKKLVTSLVSSFGFFISYKSETWRIALAGSIGQFDSIVVCVPLYRLCVQVEPSSYRCHAALELHGCCESFAFASNDTLEAMEEIFLQCLHSKPHSHHVVAFMLQNLQRLFIERSW